MVMGGVVQTGLIAHNGTVPTVGIVGGVATVQTGMVVLSAQTGTEDDVNTLSIGGSMPTPCYVTVSADTGDTITLKHGVDNFNFPHGRDIVLNGSTRVRLLVVSNTEVTTSGDGFTLEDGSWELVSKEVITSAEASWTLNGWSSNTDYTRLRIELDLIPTVNPNSVTIRPNSDSTAGNYSFKHFWYTSAVSASANSGATASLHNSANWYRNDYASGNGLSSYVYEFTRHNDTGIYTAIRGVGVGEFTTVYGAEIAGYWESTSAMTELYVAFVSGNIGIDSGYRIYQGK